MSKLSSNSLFDQINRFEITDFEMPIGDERKVLGRGSFGTVYQVSIDKTIRAVKTIDNLEDYIENPIDIANELSVMLLASHQNILKAFNYHIDEGEDQLQIIMELHGKDLKSYLETSKIENLNEFALDCLTQIVAGLKYAWEKLCAVHRDLKPQNLLYDSETKVLKIADFGCSKIVSKANTLINKKQMTTGKGTVNFMAPEAVVSLSSEKSKYSGDPKKADIFSLGLILLHIILFKDKFKAQLNRANIKKSDLLAVLTESAKKKLPKAIELVLPSITSFDPELRPDILELSFVLEAVGEEEDKYSKMDSEFFSRLMLKDESKISTWMKFIAPFIVFGAQERQFQIEKLPKNLTSLLKVFDLSLKRHCDI